MTTQTPTAPTTTAPKPPTLVRMVLDASASMEMNRDRTIADVNAYLKEVDATRAGVQILFSLMTFNSDHMHTRDEKPIGDQKPITREDYAPNGFTPLYDAIGKAIGEVKTRLAARDDNPQVVMVIFTDGQENASQEFDRAKIGELIDELSSSGWTFAYLGANQDSWAATAGMNMAASNVANYSLSDPIGQRRAMRAAAYGTTVLRASTPVGQSVSNFYATDKSGFVVDPTESITRTPPEMEKAVKDALGKHTAKKPSTKAGKSKKSL